jgi:hypothetical protein
MTDNESEYTRTVDQVLLKLFVLQFSVAVAAGHLGSLRKLEGPDHALFVVRTILYLFTPFVDLLVNAGTILFDRIQRPGHGALYVLHCIVDAPAIAWKADFGTPLIGISEERHGSFRWEIDRDRFTWK